MKNLSIVISAVLALGISLQASAGPDRNLIQFAHKSQLAHDAEQAALAKKDAASGSTATSKNGQQDVKLSDQKAH